MQPKSQRTCNAIYHTDGCSAHNPTATGRKSTYHWRQGTHIDSDRAQEHNPTAKAKKQMAAAHTHRRRQGAAESTDGGSAYTPMVTGRKDTHKWRQRIHTNGGRAQGHTPMAAAHTHQRQQGETAHTNGEVAPEYRRQQCSEYVS